MEYAVQDIKGSENLVQAEANARAPKTGFYAVFLSRIRFLCVIINLFYACLNFCIIIITGRNSQANSQRPFCYNNKCSFGNQLANLINAKIQTCIKLIGNHAKKSCLGQESDKKSSFLSSRVCLSCVYQIFQNFEGLYNILHILTQVIQTSCLLTHFCAQAVFKVPVSNTFPTHKTI